MAISYEFQPGKGDMGNRVKAIKGGYYHTDARIQRSGPKKKGFSDRVNDMISREVSAIKRQFNASYRPMQQEEIDAAKAYLKSLKNQ